MHRMEREGATMSDAIDYAAKEKALEEKGSNPDHVPHNERRLHNTLVSLSRREPDTFMKRYSALTQEESETKDPEARFRIAGEKLSVLHEFVNSAVSLFYAGMYERKLPSYNPLAQRMKEDTIKLLDDELAQIEKYAGEENDSTLRVMVRVRILEIERMKTDLEIFWTEKQMYDLHVEWSEDKAKLAMQKQRDTDKRTETIRKYIAALEEERELLLNRKEARTSNRLGYVNGRLIEFGKKVKWIKEES